MHGIFVRASAINKANLSPNPLKQSTERSNRFAERNKEKTFPSTFPSNLKEPSQLVDSDMKNVEEDFSYHENGLLDTLNRTSYIEQLVSQVTSF